MPFVERSSLGWVEVTADWYRSADGRFELWRTGSAGGYEYWLACDHDTGEFHTGTRVGCEEWCVARKLLAVGR